MSRRSYVLNTIIVTTLLVLFPTLCFAPNELNEEQAAEVRKSLARKWVKVDYKMPLGFETIFNTLPQAFWPALPELYEWRITDNTVFLYKQKYAPDHAFDFVTYQTDSYERVNYLSRWDGVTHQSFAYTRQNSPLNTNSPARYVYPIPQFTYNNQSLMNGHSIDFIDTWGLNERSKVSGMTVIESISTLDPRCYIPELLVPSGHWGMDLRNQLVQDIRRKGGCYAQYMYYAPNFLRTDDASNTAIPQGIFFVEASKEKIPLRSFQVPWDSTHKVHTPAGQLDDVLDPNTYFLFPNIHEGEKGVVFSDLSFDFIIPEGPIDYQLYHSITNTATYEIKNIVGKALLISYLIDQKRPSQEIQLWLKRLVQHARSIHQNGGYGFMKAPAVNRFFAKLKGAPYVDPTGLFGKYLEQLCSNDEDDAKIRDKSTFAHLQRLKTIKNSVIIDKPIDIDLKDMSEYQASETFIHLHRYHSTFHFNHMTTAKSKHVARNLRVAYDGGRLSPNFRVLYSPDPTNRQCSSVIHNFKEYGITIERMDSSSFASTCSTDLSRSDSSIKLSSNGNLSKSVLDVSTIDADEDENLDRFLELSREEQIAYLRQLKSQSSELNVPSFSPIKSKEENDTSILDDDNEETLDN